MMALRVWLAVILVAVLMGVAYTAGYRQGIRAPRLRSEHSEPAVRIPAGLVATTPEGKNFHRPGCKFIHGPVRMMDAREAVNEGYTPDVRCMHDALVK